MRLVLGTIEVFYAANIQLFSFSALFCGFLYQSITKPAIEGLVLRCRAYCPDRQAVKSAVVVHIEGAWADEEVPRAEWVVYVEQTRPVVAVITNVIELTVPTYARCRQEETGAVTRRKQHPINTILDGKNLSGVLKQFLTLLHRWHTPSVAPVNCGGIINSL